MGIQHSHDLVRSMQYHNDLVRCLHRLLGCSPRCRRMEGLPPVCISHCPFSIEVNLIILCNRLLKTTPALQQIVVALGATYGLYFISSFMHYEPWHMFTSFIQYMFLLPSYVNILMMYAMCNLHDVTWGTKGDNGAAKDLGGAKKVKGDDGKDMMEVEVPTAREDVDQLWVASRNALKTRPPDEKEHRDAATKQTDHDRNSRTNVVLAWVGSNMYVDIRLHRSIWSDLVNTYRLLIIVFTSTAFSEWVAQRIDTGNNAFNPYLTFLFYALYGSSFVFCCWSAN